MSINNISRIISQQKEFFNTHQTKSIGFRIEALKKLKRAILEMEKDIVTALYIDLRKTEYESYISEIGFVLRDLTQHIKKLKKWASIKRVKSSILIFPSKSYIKPEPYGTVLIMGPWNFPFQLIMTPLIGAISAGNTAIIKPAHYSQNTSSVINELISRYFDPKYLSVFLGGREINQALLEEKYDYIFFTGSTSLGKIVMETASKNLTPVSLELGGKNPCVVDSDANINIAAKRILWGRLLNNGQCCVSPDYVFVHKNIKSALVGKIISYINTFYGKDPSNSKDLPRIINKQAFERLAGLLKNGEIIAGGISSMDDKYISPTLIEGVNTGDPIMNEEIFGPILPVLEYENINEVIDYINSKSKPLSVYYFSKSKQKQKYLLDKTTSGSICFNDTIIYYFNPNLPFGGVGNSGMGRYHGKYTFETFSNSKAVLRNSTIIDLPFRYAPYKDGRLKLIRKLLK